MNLKCPSIRAVAAIMLAATLCDARSQNPPDRALTIESLLDFRIRIRWPASDPAAILEHTDALGPGTTWQVTPASPVLTDSTYSVTLDVTESERFFRLRWATEPPTMSAHLAHDTGIDPSDRITSDPSIVGILRNRSSLIGFRISVGPAARPVDILPQVGPDGGFYLDAIRLSELAGSPLADGPTSIRLEAEAPGGSIASAEVRFTLDTTSPEARLAPGANATGVLANELLEVAFNEPVFPGTTSFDGVFRPADASRLIALEHLGSPTPGTAYFDATGARLGFVPSSPFEPGSTYTWSVQPEWLADRAGNPARIAPAKNSFRTAGGLGLPGTSVAGRVYDSTPGAGGVNIPLAGARATLVSDRSQTTTTDATGRFQIDHVPSGRLMVEVDGRTVATAAGTFYPTVTELIDIVPGRTNTFPAAIYLPLARESDFAVINNTPGASTEVSNPTQLPGWSIDVPGGAVQRRDGTLAGRILMAPVPPDRLPAPLPPSFKPAVVVTIQSEDGADVFAQPVPLTAPNLEGLPPGAKTVLWDFDHARGDFIPAATMTVSADGKTVTTDPGQGVVRPGWHLIGQLILGRLRASDTVDHKNNGQPLTPAQREALAKLLNEAILTLEKTLVDTISAVPIPGPGGMLANYGLNGLGSAIGSMRNGVGPGGNPNSGFSQLADAAGAFGLTGLNAAALSSLAAAAVQQGLKIDAQQIRDALNGNEAAVQGLRDAVAGKQNARNAMNELGKLGKTANALNSLGSAASALAEWRRLVDLTEAINKLLEDPPGDDASRFLASSRSLTATAMDGAADALEVQLRAGDAALLGVQIGTLTHEWPSTSDSLTPAIRNEVVRIANVYDSNAATLAAAENRMRSTFPRALTALDSLKDLINPAPDSRVFYKVTMSDGTILRGSAAPGDSFSVRFTLGVGAQSAAVTAATVDGSRIGSSTVSVPGSPPANGAFDAPIVFLHASTAADADGNGITDDIDDVLATTPVNRAQASDLRAGISPEAAGIDLSGPVSRLSVFGIGVTDFAVHETYVYALTPSLGFAIIDFSDLMRPVFVGQLNRVNRIERISAGGGYLAATSSDGPIRFFSLEEPTSPREVFSLDLRSSNLAPALIAGGWFVVPNNGSLESYRPGSVTPLDSRLLPGSGPVLDLYFTSGHLFALRGGANPSLVSVELSAAGRFSNPSSLPLPITLPEPAAPRLSGGPEMLLVAGILNPASSVRSVLGVDIRDPQNLKVATVEHPNAIAAALDGGGHRVVVSSGPTGSELMVYREDSLSSPIHRIPLPSPPGTLVMLNGSAILASPPSPELQLPANLFAIRLPGLDRAGNPPSISFAPGFTSFEMTERSPFSVSVRAADDVRMARVELLLQGNNRVATDTSPPFELAFAAPFGLPDTDITLTARAYDTAGNVRETTVSGRYRAIAPRVTATTPVPESTIDPDLNFIRLFFDEPLARDTLPPAGGFRLAGAGVDRILGTSDDVVVAVPGRGFGSDGTQLHFAPGLLPPDSYQLTILEGTLRDVTGLSLDGEYVSSFPSGNGQPGGAFTLNFSVNRNPAVRLNLFPFRILGGSPASAEDGAIGTSPFVLADFNRDGRSDFAVARYDPVANSARINRVDVVLQNADGTFAVAIPNPAGREPVLVAAGDVNGDGFPDLVTLNWEEDGSNLDLRRRQPYSFSVLKGLGDGSFEPERSMDPGRTMLSRGVLRLADFNGDGLDDIALLVPDAHVGGFSNTNPEPAEVLIFPATGGGAFATPRELRIPFGRATSAERTSLVLGDFNGDRRVDAIVNGFALPGSPDELQGRVLLGRGDGTFDEKVSPSFGQRGREWRLEVADLDRDGRDDAIFGSKVYRSLGNGEFLEITNSGLNTLDAFGFRPFAIGELSGDRFPDLIGPGSNAAGGGFQVFHGRGDGTFVLRQQFLTNGPTRLGQIALTDLTGDGAADVIAMPDSLTDFDEDNGALTVLVSEGGKFPSLVFAPGASELRLRNVAPSEGEGESTADFNGDGRADFFGVTRRQPLTGEIGIVTSAPGGGFSAIRRFPPPAGIFPEVQWPADIDGNGQIDVVISDQGRPGRIFYYLGDGTGGLGQPTEVPEGGMLHGVVDLDGDQRPELITSVERTGGTTGGTYLAIRRNLGGGDFGPAVETRLTSTPRAVLAAFMDDDTRLDLVADTAFGNGAVVLLQVDGLRFQTAGSTSRSTPVSRLIAARDFDGDTRTDLLTMTSAFTDARLQLWPGTGNGRLASPHPFQVTTLAGTESVHAFDVNRDGALDLVGRSYSASSEARVSFGDGKGRFSRATRYVGFQNQTNGGDAVVFADFTGDGFPDLLVSGLLLEGKPD